MKTISKKILISTFLCAASLSYGDTLDKEKEVKNISKTLGHMIGDNLKNDSATLDIASVIEGLKDYQTGKEAPLSEEECMDKLFAQRAEAREAEAKINLVNSEKFLTENATQKGVISPIEGKLQYKIEDAGKGASITPTSSVYIELTGTLLDGTLFHSSEKEELISLSDIPWLAEGLIGMKEGEKRRIFVHPDLTGSENSELPPNSLLTFDVKLVKIAPTEEENRQ